MSFSSLHLLCRSSVLFHVWFGKEILKSGLRGSRMDFGTSFLWIHCFLGSFSASALFAFFPFQKRFFPSDFISASIFFPYQQCINFSSNIPRVSCLASWICNLPISAVLCKDLCLAVPCEFPCYGIFGITLLVPLLLSITSLGLFFLWMYWSSVRWLSKTQQTWESAEMLLLSACVLCHRGLG